MAARRRTSREDAWRDLVEETVTARAAGHGADPARLLDSRWFIDTLDDLVDVEPGTALAAAVEVRLAAAVDARPGFFRCCTCTVNESR